MRDDERVTLTIREAARRLGVSEGTLYRAARRGEVPTVRVGGRRLVPRAALERLLACEVLSPEPRDAA